MAAKDRSVYEIFTIRSNDGKKTIDLRGGIVSFSYFENVFSPMITAQVLVVSTGNVIPDEDGDITSIYNGLPLRGGERVEIKIAGNSAGVVASGNSTETFSSAVFSSLDNLTVGLAKLM